MCGIWGIFGSPKDVHEQVPGCFKIAHRGPDCFRFENVNHFQSCAFGFHRLAIVDDLNGMQPIRIASMAHIWMIYNGEIYNYKQLQRKYNYNYQTNCDGEALLHLYNHGGIEFMCQNLYGVFAFILFDTRLKKLYFGRDTFGVRPCFKMTSSEGTLAVCSEAKGLINVNLNTKDQAKVEIVAPGSFEEYDIVEANLDNSKNIRSNMGPIFKPTFVRSHKFHTIGALPKYDIDFSLLTGTDEMTVLANIRSCLTNAVRTRLMSHRRIGCLLSGGLDSSLIAGLVAQEAKINGITYPIQTFSIGMGEESPDIIAARKVAKHLNTEHHEVIFTPQEAKDAIRDVVKSLESYDITTIRASIGMYLLSKYIAKNTNTVVLFSGEGADEIGQGYIYFYNAPDAKQGAEESARLCEDLHYFDVCRADRTTAAHGLELRVPFLDHFFTHFYFSLHPELRNIQKENGRCEKYLIRKAFSDLNIIPNDILWRPKEAFSDGVASKKKSLFQHLQDYIDPQVSDEELSKASSKYPFNTPKTKEALFYRNIFTEYYPNCDHFTPYMWLPKWCGQITDPSARVLNHYNSQQTTEVNQI